MASDPPTLEIFFSKSALNGQKRILRRGYFFVTNGYPDPPPGL